MNTVLEHITGLRRAKPDLRISFVSGNFNVLHSGHIRLLHFAREIADRLAVGILPKNAYNAKFSESDRLNGVKALKMVDFAFVVDEPLDKTLEILRPDFVVKGKEHEYLENQEKGVVERTGGRLIFASGFARPSEEDVERLNAEGEGPYLSLPLEYSRRHAIDGAVLRGILEAVPRLRACVIGDVIVDDYIHCDPLGMSQEDPTIVVSPVKTRRFLGGAGIVAAHAASLGADVRFLTVCGEDAAAAFAAAKLDEYGVATRIFADASRPTPLKQRYRCQAKTLLRVNRIRSHGVDRELAGKILREMEEIWPDCDLLVLSDFNYGCLPQFLVDAIMEQALKHRVPVAADSQSSSQIGDVSRFRGALLLTPTEREARLAMRDFESGLVVLARSLVNKAAARHLILTLGAAGAIVHASDPESAEQLPALNANAKDPAGAGDSMLIAAALALVAGGDIWHAAYMGALAAGIQVSREGNIPLRPADLMRQLAI